MEIDIIGPEVTRKEVPVETTSLKRLFDENLDIPEYQRPYKWKERHVLKLLDNVWHSYNSRKETYRIGTVILHRDEDRKLNIVDGQQRLVTITLILKFLGNDSSPLLESNVSHTVSKNNIRYNYTKIKDWFNSLNFHQKSEFREYLLKNCEVVRIELQDISEAFQLFDSQNARGKALEPYDLLKAFHLREMDSNTSVERLQCVQQWEKAVNDGLLNNLGKYIYRILLNHFGNLCLISQKSNSKYNDYSVTAKREQFEKRKTVESLKQAIMFSYENWNTNEIKQHGYEMKLLLEKYNIKSPAEALLTTTH